MSSGFGAFREAIVPAFAIGAQPEIQTTIISPGRTTCRRKTLQQRRSKREPSNGARRFLHRGIAGRGFERRFVLADHILVSGAKLENGLLHIALRHEVPEALKPRQIPVHASRPAALMEAAPQAA